MASLYMHMAFSKEVNKKLGLDEEQLMAGTIAADTCFFDNDKYKTYSHFGSRIVKANADEFMKKYKDSLKDPFVFGYFAHLYVDQYFYEEVISNKYELISGKSYIDPAGVFINKKTNKKVNYNQIYIEDNRLYKDYALTSYPIFQKYNLKNEVDLSDVEEIIEEIDSNKLDRINKELEKYKPKRIEGKTNCISLEDTYNFIEKYVDKFFKDKVNKIFSI